MKVTLDQIRRALRDSLPQKVYDEYAERYITSLTESIELEAGKMTTLMVPLFKGGHAEVRAYMSACGQWAVHRSLDRRGPWTLTHAPSGLSVGADWPTQRAALRAMRAVVDAGIKLVPDGSIWGPYDEIRRLDGIVRPLRG
jgi:hypothetical protein